VNSNPDTGSIHASNEMRLLLHCCRYGLEKNDSVLKSYISGTQIDWPGFILHTAQQRMFPLVNSAFKNCAGVVPIQVQKEVAGYAAKNLKRMMSLAGELGEIHQLFETNTIGFISLKGPLMVLQLYGDYAWRQTRDIDLLVEETTIDQAVSVLTGAGYILLDEYFTHHPEKRGLYMKRENHVRFRHPFKTILIELHWAVSKYFTTISTAELFHHKIGFAVNDKNYNTLSINDYFIVLATHGIYHRYELLFWLYDIAHILSIPGIKPNEILAHAAKFNCITSVKVSMELAYSLMNIPRHEDNLQLQKLTDKEQFIYNQCIDTILGTNSHNPTNKTHGFFNTIVQRFLHQKFLMLMTDDRQSKKRVLLNTLIKPYVWHKDSKLPKNNFIYLFLTQLKWVQLVISDKLTKGGKIRNIKQLQK
jgi:hypothetical protein